MAEDDAGEEAVPVGLEAELLAEEAVVGFQACDDDADVVALHAVASAELDGVGLADAGDDLDVETGMHAPAPPALNGPLHPGLPGDAFMADLVHPGGGPAGAGGPGPAAAPPGPPAPGGPPPLPQPAAKDTWETWMNGRVDNERGRLPTAPRPETRFRTANINPTSVPPAPGPESGLAFLRLLWDDDICALAVKWTNVRLAALRAAAHHKPLTVEELWLWQAVTATMGICKLPTIESYWSKVHYGEAERWEARCGVCVMCGAALELYRLVHAAALPCSHVIFRLHGAWYVSGAVLRHQELPKLLRR